MSFAVFHDCPGLENGPPKCHDFPGPVGTLLQRGTIVIQSTAWNSSDTLPCYPQDINTAQKLCTR